MIHNFMNFQIVTLGYTFKVTQNIYMKTKVQISVYVGSMYYISYFLFCNVMFSNVYELCFRTSTRPMIELICIAIRATK